MLFLYPKSTYFIPSFYPIYLCYVNNIFVLTSPEFIDPFFAPSPLFQSKQGAYFLLSRNCIK